jgi:hypothetical protein
MVISRKRLVGTVLSDGEDVLSSDDLGFRGFC